MHKPAPVIKHINQNKHTNIIGTAIHTKGGGANQNKIASEILIKDMLMPGNELLLLPEFPSNNRNVSTY